MTLTLDHLAVAGESLADATAHVEEVLGVALQPGGVHVEMGTHNRLLSLGPGVYLEAIAVNPDAAHPGRPRWFALDHISGRPRLANWIARTGDLEGAVAAAPDGMGVPIAFSRGDYHWQMAVPGNGCLPYGGAAPALIQWDTALHPADSLQDVGCRLVQLEVSHPDAARLLAEFPVLADMAGVTITHGPEPHLAATIETPHGVRVLT